MEKELIEALQQIVDDFEDLGRGIVTQASINRAKRVIEAAQQQRAADVAYCRCGDVGYGDKFNRCVTCGQFKAPRR